MSQRHRHKDRWIVRASLAGLVGVLCFLAGFSVVTRHSVAVKSASADRATRLSATYQDARHWVSEQKSVERQYRIEGSYAVLAAHRQAERTGRHQRTRRWDGYTQIRGEQIEDTDHEHLGASDGEGAQEQGREDEVRPRRVVGP